MLTKKLSAVIPVDDPSPLAYMNVFEEGDIWVKIKGCEECPIEQRAKCCGTCPLFAGEGCYFHFINPKNSQKPFKCVVKPNPSRCKSTCCLEFVSVKGTQKGQIRRIRDKQGVFTGE